MKSIEKRYPLDDSLNYNEIAEKIRDFSLQDDELSLSQSSSGSEEDDDEKDEKDEKELSTRLKEQSTESCTERTVKIQEFAKRISKLSKLPNMKMFSPLQSLYIEEDIPSLVGFKLSSVVLISLFIETLSIVAYCNDSRGIDFVLGHLFHGLDERCWISDINDTSSAILTPFIDGTEEEIVGSDTINGHPSFPRSIREDDRSKHVVEEPKCDEHDGKCTQATAKTLGSHSIESICIPPICESLDIPEGG
ncbi:hypothetical protein ADUPG1_000245, partial [Aduncisulcus paluster]